MPKPEKIKKSLRASFLDGIFASAMLGLITDYVIPYALALKASLSQIGLLAAAPNFVSSLSQSAAPHLTGKFGGRKTMVCFFVLLQALVMLPVIFLPALFRDYAVSALIVLSALFISLGAFAGPAWASMMSDHIPAKKRGAYFGFRNKVTGTITVSCACISGGILHFFRNDPLSGFAIIFSLAFLARLASWYCLSRMFEPALPTGKDSYFSILDFLRRSRRSNFARFVFFVTAFYFCLQLAAPFFSVFMLRELKFGYLTYTFLIAAVTFAHIFAIGRWGKLADRAGNLKVIRLTAIIIACNPLLWLLNRHPAYLLFCQLLAGFAWAGFLLCCTNFIYDAVSPAKRIRCIAYFNVFSGLGASLGALLGGYLVNALPEFLGYKILSLFLVAGFCRLAVVMFFSGKIREVRSAEHISSRDLFIGAMGLSNQFMRQEE